MRAVQIFIKKKKIKYNFYILLIIIIFLKCIEDQNKW